VPKVPKKLIYWELLVGLILTPLLCYLIYRC